MANLAKRAYTKSDSERFLLNVRSVAAMKQKYNLTSQDLLNGLAYGMPKERWEEMINQAREDCVQYETYHGYEQDSIDATYGEI